MKVDFFKNEINIGDTVAFASSVNQAIDILEGVVDEMTEKMAYIRHYKAGVGNAITKRYFQDIIVKK